jgi:hypothetical protein
MSTYQYLRLVASNDSGRAADSSTLFAVYGELKDVWHRTKIEANRQRAMRAYNAWIVGSFPKEQQQPLLLSSRSTWGFN